MSDNDRKSRREFLASVFAGIGVLASYSLLAGEGLMFLLPGSGKAKTRKIFAGQIDQFEPGAVRTFYDISGNEILLRRSAEGFQAFDSTCPHLGCKVRWQKEKNRFHCPCHNGVFNPDGIAISGPPGDAGQKLTSIPVEVDEKSGVIYLEVRDAKA